MEKLPVKRTLNVKECLIKMKKKLFGIIAIAAVIVFSLVSCGSGNSANPQELVGKWEYQSGYSPFSGYDEVELFRDGTGVVSGGGFSWKVVDKRLVITHPLFALACNYKVSGPTVTLFYDNGKSGTFINRKSPGGKSAGNAPEVLGGFGSRLSALFGGGGEYTIHFSEDVEGVIMVFKDAGKIIIRSSASEGFSIDNTLCPILPKDQSFYVYSYGETIIDGNTTTWTDHDGLVCKTVTAGNTTTLTDHDGSLIYKKS
jgi:hypothetical protein